VNRRLALVVAALIVPGGLLALLGAWLIKAFSQTDKGQRALSLARERVRLRRRADSDRGRVPDAA
jgi:hypothetical protein